jgi:hypothetical protein
MHGSVEEFCLDRCDRRGMSLITNTYRDGVIDPVNTFGKCFVTRAGGANQGMLWYRSAERNLLPSRSTSRTTGFRIVLGPEDVPMKMYESLTAAKTDPQGAGVDDITAGKAFIEDQARLVFRNITPETIVARASIAEHSLFSSSMKPDLLVINPKQAEEFHVQLNAKAGPVTGFHAVPYTFEYFDAENRNRKIDEGKGVIYIDSDIPLAAAERKVAVDANLEDWPELPFGTHEKAVAVGLPEHVKSPEDCSFRFGVTWDTDAVYVAVQVTDDHYLHHPLATHHQIWNQDGVDIQIDARPMPDRGWNRGNSSALDYARLCICPGTTSAETFVFKPAKGLVMDGLKAASIRTETGYVVEVAIPNSWFQEQFGAPWESFRLNVSVSDFDDPAQLGKKKTDAHEWLNWRPHWRSTRTFFNSGSFVRARE